MGTAKWFLAPFWKGIVRAAAVLVAASATDDAAAWFGASASFWPKASAAVTSFFFDVITDQTAILIFELVVFTSLVQVVNFASLGILANFFIEDFSEPRHSKPPTTDEKKRFDLKN
jgi:hypothetical protein